MLPHRYARQSEFRSGSTFILRIGWRQVAPYRDSMRVLLAVIASALLIGHALCPAQVQLDSQSLVLIGLLIVIVALPLLDEATFLGMKLKLREAQQLAEKVRRQKPPEPPDGEGVRGGSEPLGPAPPSVRTLASEQPALAAAAIRRDLENVLRQAYSAYSGKPPPDTLAALVDAVTSYGLLSNDAAELALRLGDIAATAAHSSKPPSARDVARMVELRDTVVNLLATGPAKNAIEFEDQVWRILAAHADEVHRQAMSPGEYKLDFMAQIGGRTLGVEAVFLKPGLQEWRRRLRERTYRLMEYEPDWRPIDFLIVVPSEYELNKKDRGPVNVLTIAELPKFLGALAKYD